MKIITLKLLGNLSRSENKCDFEAFNTIFKVIIALILKKFCFRVKAIHLQDITKSPITESKFR